MKKILNFKIVALFIALFICGNIAAQGIKDIRINEVLVKNSNNLMDDYGQRSSWIELFNTGYSNVDLAGAHLSVKLGDKAMTYKIPDNDSNTNIPPQGYVVFYADGAGAKGTFYTNFTLDQTNEIYFLNAGGSIIDSIKYDTSELKEDVSMGWAILSRDSGEIFTMELDQSTPNATNNTLELESRAEIFRKEDPLGIIMALTAMTVVFSALFLLYQVFKAVGKTMIKAAVRKENKVLAKENLTSSRIVTEEDESIPGDVIAAIGVALNKYEEDLHDLESTVITINRVAKSYSPWSSKIYGINNQPNRK